MVPDEDAGVQSGHLRHFLLYPFHVMLLRILFLCQFLFHRKGQICVVGEWNTRWWIDGVGLFLSGESLNVGR